MSPRVYERKFDRGEAQRLRAEGLSYAKIAARLGVTDMAIYAALNDSYRERMAGKQAQWQRDGTCPDCGKPATRNGLDRQHRCNACAVRLKATSVRETELQCVNCREWKPDEGFPKNRAEPARRGRHSICRACNTILRADYRARHVEAARLYNREYKRRRAAQK